MALRSDSLEIGGEYFGDRSGDVDLERDRALVERCQTGDRSAFDVLYQRYHRRLTRFCLQRLRSPHDAEDVVQETFARAWRALPGFAGERRFYPWLTVIANNLCVDVQRSRNRLTPVDSSQLQLGDPGCYDTEDAVLHEVDAQMVTTAFARLHPRHQRVLQLREESGWSYQQIADHEGVGIAAVETLLWRARQSLKREFASLAGPEGGAGVLSGLLVVFRHRVFRAFARPVRVAVGSARHAGAWLSPLLTPAGAISGTFAVGMIAASIGIAVPASTAAARPHPVVTYVLPVTGVSLPGVASGAFPSAAPPGAATSSGAVTSSGAASSSSLSPALPSAPGPSVTGTGVPGAGGAALTGSGDSTSGAGTAQALSSGVSSLGTALSGAGQAGTTPVSDAAGALGGTAQALSSGVSSLGTALSGGGQAVTTPVSDAAGALGGTAQALSSGVSSPGTALSSGVSSLGTALSGAGQAVTTPVSDAAGDLGGGLGSVAG